MSRDYNKKRKDGNFCSKLRMDANVLSQTRNHGVSGKYRELDNVMRKARESQSNYWNKKVLEVEEKDPDRWRHSGFKEMYINNASSGNFISNPKTLRYRSSRSRSPRQKSPRPRSPRIRSPYFRNSNSPCIRNLQLSKSHTYKSKISRSPRRRSPRNINSYISKSKSPTIRRLRESKVHSPKSKKIFSSTSRTILKQNYCMQELAAKSPSSGSTCSDQSCSVCSRKSLEDDRQRINTSISRSRSNTKSTSPVRLPSLEKKKASTNKILLNRQEKCSSSQRSISSPIKTNYSLYCSKEPEKIINSKTSKKEKNFIKKLKDQYNSGSVQMFHKHVKQENVNTNYSDVCIINPAAASSPSDDSDSSSTTSHILSPKMTLSERFGKMAQWSVDRKDMENMRITKIGDTAMKVVIEGEEKIPQLFDDPLPPGHYPDYLLSQGPRGHECWDDVRVRYEYYKSRGYLRDLLLDDYIKWEEWWYKYQEWLEAERYYEQWTTQTSNRITSSGNRKRRRRNNNTH